MLQIIIVGVIVVTAFSIAVVSLVRTIKRYGRRNKSTNPDDCTSPSCAGCPFADRYPQCFGSRKGRIK